MPRQSGFTVENSFTGAWVTEFHGLSYPENTVFETENCVFTFNGKVKRRLGIDFESGYAHKAVSKPQSESVIKEFVWESVAGQGALTFVVVQIGNTIHFYESGIGDALSDGNKSFTIDLTSYKTTGATNSDIYTNSAHFSNGFGYLFITHPFCDPLYVEYDVDGDSITVNSITVKIRDTRGIDDTLDIDERPSSLSDSHKYNLYNQGWDAETDVDGGGVTEALTYWDANRSDYPSNADIFWVFRNANDELDDSFFDRTYFGTTMAPRGHYILDAFNQDRSTVSGVSNIDIVSSSKYRPSNNAFYAGRVWYAGVNYQEFSTKIYFSQLIQDEQNFAKCYQEHDPTSEYLNDLLATDGGVIEIPEMGKVINMVPVQSLLVIFASNGIWAIGGSEAGFFDATNYSISKISGLKSLSDYNFVDVEGFPCWWNNDGIWLLQFDASSGGLSPVSLTRDTIKTYYSELPTNVLQYAKGAYNVVTNEIFWLYRDEEATDLGTAFDCNKVLVHNFRTKQFYKWEIAAGTPEAVGIISTEGIASVKELENVTNSSGTDVTTSSLEDVEANDINQEVLGASFRFLTLVNTSGLNYNMTFSQSYDTRYVDWYTHDTTGVNYDSYFDTGYKLRGDGIRKWQNNYITIHHETEADSSVFIQGRWDYANNSGNNRFSTKQQAYKADTLQDYQFRRLKIRGTGRALHLRFSSEDGKPFNVIGWSMWDTVNAAV